jgi:hypothetical protein
MLDWGMLGWVAHHLSAVTLAAVFALAVAHKLRDFRRFQASLMAYEIIPDLFIRLFAPLVVGLEIAAVGVLLLHEGRGPLLAFTLLGVYSMAIGINMARGKTQIDCGCGDIPTPLSSWLLLRNLVLMGLALGAGGHPVAQGSPAAWLLVAAGVLCLLGFYLIVEHLLANLPFLRNSFERSFERSYGREYRRLHG